MSHAARAVVLVVLFGIACPIAPAESRGMVASADPIATRVGVEVLESGGNAVDAAVAVSFALAVVFPQAGNLGGGGLLLYAPGDGGPVSALDFRETAPAGASRDMFLDPKGEPVPEKSTVGWLAVGIPGTVRGLEEVHRRFGRLPWKDLLAPAIRLAAEGFPVGPGLARSLATHAATLARFPESAAVFLSAEGAPLAEGAILIQKDLAWSLSEIANGGAAAFYEGEIAARLAKGMSESGGLVTAADLKGYRAVWRDPIHVRYRGLDVYSMPPPSSGGVCLGMLLGLAERGAGGNQPADLARLSHQMIEWERRVYAERSRHLGDPDFHEVPIDRLLSAERLDALARSVDPGRPTESRDVSPSEETTHFSIVDGDRNAVSLTTTLNSAFGSMAMAAGTGFLLNNEMDDFSAKPGAPNLYGLVGGTANQIEPGKRMLSSMTPTIVRRNGKIFLVLGTPGGATIITTIFQVLVHRVDRGLSLAEAVAHPRFHHQWVPDLVYHEPGWERIPGHLEALQAMGHALQARPPIGDVQAIEIDPAAEEPTGTSDPRGQGLALATR